MRRFVVFAILMLFALLLNDVFITSTTPQAQAQTVGNYWDGAITVEESANPIDNRYALYRTDCIPRSGLEQLEFGFPYTTVFDGVPFIDSTNQAPINEERCVILGNDAGVFTSDVSGTIAGGQRSYLYGGDSTRLTHTLRVADQTDNWIDPAPRGPYVLRLTRRSRGSSSYSMTVITHMGDGNRKVDSTRDIYWETDGETREPLALGQYRVRNLLDHEFSPNGRYLAIHTGRNIGVVDLVTLTYTPVYYANNLQNARFAVSNDGRYVTIYKNGLYVVDTADCERVYPSNNWVTVNTTIAGCAISADLETDFRTQIDKNDLQSRLNDWIHRIRFDDVLNDRFYLSIGERRADAIFGSSAPTAYDWTEYQLRAVDYEQQLAGYIALGDSFSSGEGDLDAEWYEPGTDEQGNIANFEGRNLCHLSRRSYPYLLAKQLGYLNGTPDEKVSPSSFDLFHSLACSGAKIHNITQSSTSSDGEVELLGSEKVFETSPNQYTYGYFGELGLYQPGRIKQLDIFQQEQQGDLLRGEQTPEVITVGIGGNDADFGNILFSCTLWGGTCKYAEAGSEAQSTLAITIAEQKQRLESIYTDLKLSNPGARIYAVGYPRFIADPATSTYNCAQNVRLNFNETELVRQGIDYMNQVIEAAARSAGVIYVDMTEALAGHELCSDGVKAFNGLTHGNDIDGSNPVAEGCKILAINCSSIHNFIGNESFHPNPFGQKLMAEHIAEQTSLLSTAMPQSRVVDTPLPPDYFGARARSAVQAANTTGSSAGDHNATFDWGPFAEIRDNTTEVEVYKDGFLPGTIGTISIESERIVIGEFNVDQNGVISTSFALPEQILTDPGLHELLLEATTSTGAETISVQRIYVPHAVDDADGDGVLDSDDSCMVVENTGVDLDQDGIDDACDIEVTTVGDPVIEDEGEEDPDEGMEEEPQEESGEGSEEGSGEEAEEEADEDSQGEEGDSGEEVTPQPDSDEEEADEESAEEPTPDEDEGEAGQDEVDVPEQDEAEHTDPVNPADPEQDIEEPAGSTDDPTQAVLAEVDEATTTASELPSTGSSSQLASLIGLVVILLSRMINKASAK